MTKLLVDGGVYLYADAPSGDAVRHQPHLADLMQQVAEALRGQGFNPYVLPGSTQPVGALGYVECALELATQCDALGIQPDWIFLTSTGCGQAGLLLGAKVLEQNHQVVGCACAPYGTDAERAAQVASLADRTAELLAADTRIDPGTVINLDYSGGAYGVPTQDGMDALRLVAQTEGIFLDPVYTAKSMAGLIDQWRRGRIGANESVIFVHTGGTPLNFAYHREIAEAYHLSLETDQSLPITRP